MNTALTLVQQQPQRNPFDPTSLSEAMTLAKTLSTSQLIPTALANKPQDLLLIMIKGRELGLSTMQALSGINVIKGKAVMEAALLVGLILRHTDVAEYFTVVESTEKRATYETKRRGAPSSVRMSFTIEEATRAGLTSKDNWKTFPAAMLRARAAAALARAVYPDLAAGIYVPGEIPGADEPGLAAPREVNPQVAPAVEEPHVEPEPDSQASATDAEVFNQDGEDYDLETGVIPEKDYSQVRIPASWKGTGGLLVSEVPLYKLQSTKAYLEKTIADPEKAKYAESNRELLDAVSWAIARPR